MSPESWHEAMTRLQKLFLSPFTEVSVDGHRSAATYHPASFKIEILILIGRIGTCLPAPAGAVAGCRARCGAADLLGVCDVKDLMGPSPLSGFPGSDFSVQPRIPEAARIYCILRANFAL